MVPLILTVDYYMHAGAHKHHKTMWNLWAPGACIIIPYMHSVFVVLCCKYLHIYNKNASCGVCRYLLSVKWFRKWKEYVGFDPWNQQEAGAYFAYPGPIDNLICLQVPQIL